MDKNEINRRLYIVEENISEFGGIVRKTIHNERQREKDWNKQCIRELPENFNCLTIYVIKVPNYKNKRIRKFEEIMGPIFFSNLIKDINPCY